MSENKQSEIYATYCFPILKDLGKIAEESGNLNRAKELVHSNYPNISLQYYELDPYKPLDRLEYKFVFSGPADDVGSAFATFFRKAFFREVKEEEPRVFLPVGSDYELADRVLDEFGKITDSSRTVRFRSEGRWVIDKE